MEKICKSFQILFIIRMERKTINPKIVVLYKILNLIQEKVFFRLIIIHLILLLMVMILVRFKILRFKT